ncbi:hypothetical protein B0H15DRAFT_943560 [Mycena belliarum]|uniref:Uncharacterized protein n=1 Tax=Mycena belliarum TaxID=1033014 RepID=A0AAD6UG03_9AGAR|nr:hypothetical protein B0H15DRAFT_943560 [Mycena belliae]
MDTKTPLAVPAAQERIMARMKANNDAVSLRLKREALDAGDMTPGLKIWLSMGNDKPVVLPPRPTVRAYDRIIADIQARHGRRDHSTKIRARAHADLIPRPVLRLRRSRDRRLAETTGKVLGRAVFDRETKQKENMENLVEKSMIEARVKHLAGLWKVRTEREARARQKAWARREEREARAMGM